MFRGITTTGKFLTSHGEVYLTVHTPQDYGSLERMGKAHGGIFTHIFREKLDATNLASFQANQYSVHARCHLQMQRADNKKEISTGFGRSSNVKPFRATGVFHGCSSTAN